MKKFARWALAFASVMSIPTSAMALPEFTQYQVCLSNGARIVDLGFVVFTYIEQVAAPFGDLCRHQGKWCNFAALATCTNTYVAEELSIMNQACDENSLFPADTNISLDPLVPPESHWAFNKFQMKVRIHRLNLTQDSFTGVIKGLAQYHPLAVAYPIKFTPRAQP
ncbi:hypothetical protein [Sorangium sp. So ce131]|uniref:hypothetical protein n=1 Tax=Sorangium sp. So ce131 TaxID=3133282 RepID=UPI003F5E052C